MYAGALRTSMLRAARAMPRGHYMPSSHSTGVPRSTPASAFNASAFNGLRLFGAKPDTSDVLPQVKEGPAGEVASIFDQATGLERAEIDHPDLFKHNEVLRGPFGTHENPVLIQSNFESRIVGCTGRAAPEDHDLFWLNVEKGSDSVCPECGQVFKLEPL